MIRARPSREDILPLVSELQKQFREKFQREMTPEEIRLYTLTKDMIEKPGFLERRVLQMPVGEERRERPKKRAKAEKAS